MTPNSPFYIAINQKRLQGSSIWYKNQPLGEDTLRSIVRDMAERANLPGRKTNHSARKTTCTKLLHAGIAPTTIQQLTGQRKVQSINNYAIASVEMQKTMSDILSNKVNAPNAENHACPVATYPPCSNPTPNSMISTSMSPILSN